MPVLTQSRIFSFTHSNEIRIYPLVTFEAEPSSYLERLRKEPEFANKAFEIVSTQFEFLANSNCFLRVM